MKISLDRIESLKYLIPLSWLILVVAMGYEIYGDLHTVRNMYVKKESEKTARVKATLEQKIGQIYQSLRTLSRLPSVKRIDRYGKNMDADSRKVFQEIYNNLFLDVHVSEIYIVPKDMEPDQLDPVTKKNQEPIITFDEFILGRGPRTPPIINSSDATKDKKIPEIEIYEYREMKSQLAWFEQYFPKDSTINGLIYPALFSREVVTCDNSRLIAGNINDKDRSGIVFSLPFFSENGDFKGLISSVILTSVLAEILPDEYYMISNSFQNYEVLSSKLTENSPESLLMRGHSKASELANSLIYSESSPLHSFETNSKWKIWSGKPNSQFWKSDEVSEIAKQALFHFFMLSLVLSVVQYFVIQLTKKEHDRMKNLLIKFHGSSVAEDLINQTYSVGGKSRDVLVFFCDIRNFSSFSEQNTPQDVVSMLNDYFKLVVTIIDKRKGLVDKFIGDGILAVWGAPKRRPTDIENAIMTCLEIRVALENFNNQRMFQGLSPIKLGMGLHAGQVISGIIGSEERMEYTIIGNTVNIASRIEAATKSFDTDVLVSDEIFRLAQDKFTFELAGAVQIKGYLEPKKLYKVTGYRNEKGEVVIVRTSHSEFLSRDEEKIKKIA